MRQKLKVVAIVIFSVSVVDLAIWVIDNTARWQWLSDFLLSNPSIAAFIKTPYFFAVLMAFLYLTMKAQAWTKEPDIKATWANLQFSPHLGTAPVKAMIDNSVKIDWDMFVEIKMVNKSEYSVTTDHIEATVALRKNWLHKNVVKVEHLDDCGKYDMDFSHDRAGKARRWMGDAYKPLHGLLDQIKGVPLQRGVGHKGWLHFRVHQISEKEKQELKIILDINIFDALQIKHSVKYNRGSEKMWDDGFYILER